MTKIKRIMASKVLPKDKIYLFGKWETVTDVDSDRFMLFVHINCGFNYIDVSLLGSTVIRVQREEVK